MCLCVLVRVRSGFKFVPWKLGRLLPAELLLAAVAVEERRPSFQQYGEQSNEADRSHNPSHASSTRERHYSRAVDGDQQRRGSGDDSLSSGEGAAPLCTLTLNCDLLQTEQ